jgi:hypothetical protein
MDLGKEAATGVGSEVLSSGAGEAQEEVKQESNRSGPFGDLLKDSSVQKGQDLGDPRQERDSGLLHTLQQVGRLQALQECDSGPAKDREKKCHHERVHVVEREHGEHIVLGGAHVEPLRGQAVRHEIVMGEHHPFGASRCSRGVEDRGDRVRWRRGERVLLRVLEDLGKGMDPRRGLLIQQDDLGMKWKASDERAYLVQFGLRDDDGPALRMVKEILHLLSPQLDIEGDRGGSRSHDSQISHAPLRPVLGEKGDTMAGGNLTPAEEPCETTRPICDFAVAEANVLSLALGLESHPVGEASCRLEKLDGDGQGW